MYGRLKIKNQMTFLKTLLINQEHIVSWMSTMLGINAIRDAIINVNNWQVNLEFSSDQ
jgi:hypothetical protein